MQFLKTLFWALLVGVMVAFALNNMTMVPLKLWGSLYADVNLPLLLLVTFLAGFLPTFVALHLTRWRLRQRIVATDRTLADLHRDPPASLPADPAPIPAQATPGGVL
ncbi:lipopolysaccharide assembly protein LapA domain-containing protein [Sphingomonas sp. 2R-10]|uniref:lipopolysaccharide assembly protein LapA domain-containing protein n=1 Tax=Sphingomonas sp. 2R-10 TaxID=3045148 RepID=UPI000F770748|nr:lipopolysaccharide assembly protein LapA domain-containing protein [Sphingomonas sp. 2R-10]MDJ0278518.1 lipopolysaccharide assembly protein LapA domain-containing protein [Sphingomonas sp. 2R-10]